MATVTYNTFLETHPDPIVDVSDETVQQAVADWFGYRYIGFEDQSKFLAILRRNVSAYYPMYSEKLRIQPGVRSRYDWLVNQYRELQHTSNGSHGTETQHEADKTTGTTTGTSNSNTTHANYDVKVRTGNETHTRTGGHSESDRPGTTQTKERFIKGNYHTSDNPHVTTRTSNVGRNTGYSGDTNVSAGNPMSKEYSSHITPTPTADGTGPTDKSMAYNGMPTDGTNTVIGGANYAGGLDWTTLSTQAQAAHEEYANTNVSQDTEYIYPERFNGQGNRHYYTTTGPDKRTTTTEAKSAGKRETTYNNERDKIQYNEVTDDTKDTGRQTTTGETGGTSEVNNEYGNIYTSAKDSSLDREIYTGRSGNAGGILMEAVAFIESSSAWLWLREQLDSCFFPGYYTDTFQDEDGNEYEEGDALV